MFTTCRSKFIVQGCTPNRTFTWNLVYTLPYTQLGGILWFLMTGINIIIRIKETGLKF